MSVRVLIVDLDQDNNYQQILNGEPETCGMRSGRVFLRRGESCGKHNTNAQEEMLVFLSGFGQALVGEEEGRYQVCEGKVVYIPPYTAHDIKNTGTEPLVYIYCVAPVSKARMSNDQS
jgi:oxalate decarboxylase/phosphoglucose isomerase-like protein (cupin superfamily)